MATMMKKATDDYETIENRRIRWLENFNKNPNSENEFRALCFHFLRSDIQGI